MKAYLFGFALLMLTFRGVSQDVTFTKDIAPIIYNNCTKCHRPGEIGPFPLTNYNETRIWAPMIQYVTSIRYMPPWKADPHYSSFIGERVLSQDEINKIAKWVQDGTPYGNADEEPPLPQFPTGSQIGVPDLVLSMAEAYPHVGGNKDEYRVFVLPTGLTEDKQIATVELRPGNAKTVHHALLSYDNTGTARALDDAEPGYGYDGFGGFGIDEAMGRMFPGYVPGQKPIPYPEGLGQLLPKNSDILVQMHYGPYPTPSEDSSTINIFFKKESVERQVQNFIFLPIPPYLQNDVFVMFPNTVKTFHVQYTTPIQVSLFAIWPHAHLLNKSYEVFAVHPNGDTTNLIRIPDWDFNWQGSYNFKKYIVLEPGTTVHAFATYDNTVANPNNPNNPPAIVSWGEKTTDEMLFLPISFVLYKPGDEDINLDDETTPVYDSDIRFVQHYLSPVQPNPSNTTAYLNYFLEVSDHVSIRILDMEGRVVKTILQDEFLPSGSHGVSADVTDFAPGTYFVQMTGTNFMQSQKMVVIR